MKAFYTYSKGSQGNRSLTAFVQVNAFNRVVLKKDVTWGFVDRSDLSMDIYFCFNIESQG